MCPAFFKSGSGASYMTLEIALALGGSEWKPQNTIQGTKPHHAVYFNDVIPRLKQLGWPGPIYARAKLWWSVEDCRWRSVHLTKAQHMALVSQLESLAAAQREPGDVPVKRETLTWRGHWLSPFSRPKLR
jgi:hypothetical protein